MSQFTPIALVAASIVASAPAQLSRESVATNGSQAGLASHEVAMSADGRYLAIASEATNLVPGTAFGQVYLRDRQLLQTTVVSVSPAGAFANDQCIHPAISADGRYVAFASAATNLGVASTTFQVFVHDRVAATTQCASVSTSGVVGSFYSILPAISADGRYVAFVSRAGNLIDGSTLPATERVYVRDLLLGTTSAVSVDVNGAPAAGTRPAISADGRYVTFTSAAAGIVPNDGNSVGDVFLRDRAAGTTEIVSVTPTGTTGSAASYESSISADGRMVAFSSVALDLVPFTPLNGFRQILVRDRLTQTTSLVTLARSGVPATADADWPSISADGRHVAFSSPSTDLVIGDTNGHTDVFVRDLLPAVTHLASRANDGSQGNGNSPSVAISGLNYAFGAQGRISISADGRFVAFESLASNLVPLDTNAAEDVFLADRGCSVQFATFGHGLAGTGGGVPVLVGLDGPGDGSAAIVVANGLGGAPCLLALGLARAVPPIPTHGGLIYVDVSQPVLVLAQQLQGAPGAPFGGSWVITGQDQSALAGLTLYLQAFIADPAATSGFSMTNAMSMTIL
jgi:Tol biopolymer transport system component